MQTRDGAGRLTHREKKPWTPINRRFRRLFALAAIAFAFSAEAAAAAREGAACGGIADISCATGLDCVGDPNIVGHDVPGTCVLPDDYSDRAALSEYEVAWQAVGSTGSIDESSRSRYGAVDGDLRVRRRGGRASHATRSSWAGLPANSRPT